MKKLILTFILMVAMASVVWSAPYLASDIPTGAIPIVSQIEVNGNLQPNPDDSESTYHNIQLSADGLSFLLLDLVGFPKGVYTFRIRWHDGMSFWSDWSDPFVAGKPAKSGSVRIVEQ